MPSKLRSRKHRTLGMGLALLAPLGLLACTGSQSGDAQMEIACQFKACVCAEDDAPLLIEAEEVEVLWREENGYAYCPEGYELAFDD